MDLIKKIFTILLIISLGVPFLTAFATVSAAENDVIKGNPVTITDDVTGCTYNYVNFDGEELIRPYVGMQSWTSDGKSFLCGANGTMYLYNTETNEFTEIGPGLVHTHVDGFIGADDCVYYVRSKDIMKYDIKTKTNTVILPGSVGYTPGGLTVSNDGNYIISASKTYGDYYCEDGETGVFRYNIATKEVECYGHKFDYSNIMNHFQINPTDPDIVYVCHEADIGEGETQVADYRDVYDREWAVDFKTGIFENIFKQGITSDNQNILFTTHESWGASGKYLYIDCYSNASSNGKGNCIIRCYKDGSHREYLKGAHANADLSVDHAMASGDDKFTVVDSNQGRYVYVLSNDTYEQFPIYYSATGHTETTTDESGNEISVDKGHPYHPHPNVARNHYKVHWGIERDGVVGVAWYDFTSIARNIASGGRYSVNEYIDRVSYSGLDCESDKVYYEGEEAIYAKAGNYIYFDISDAVVDGTNESITVTFDYYDNGKYSGWELWFNDNDPLEIIYTDGASSEADDPYGNDLANSEDAKVEIERDGSKGWESYTLTIDSGNFENINPYRTDLKIGGGGTDAYIANIQVSNAPAASTLYAGGDGTKENPYLISTPEQLKHFTHDVRTTTDKTEVDSNVSYTDSNSSTYSPKRYHVFTDKYFKLTNDINMSGDTWLPIGNLTHTFNGHFDGDGHVISNIYINATAPDQFERYAFFGATGANVEIKNLGLENVDCQFIVSDNTFTVPESAYTYTERTIGAAGFVSLYAGGKFENCYLENAEVRDLTEQMSSGGTGAFFGTGYGTVSATADNGYNQMTVKNCYVNGAVIRAHSNVYGFIGPNIKPNTTVELGDSDSYRVTKNLTNCYTANIERGYYSDSLGKSDESKAYDGGLYPFACTIRNTTLSDCYTTSKGEKTTVSSDGTTFTYSTAELADNGTKTTDYATLTKGLIDNSNYYADIKGINGGYPVHTEVYDLKWDGKIDKKPKGEGTEESPYLISCKEELMWFKNSVNTISEEGYENGYVSCADSYFRLTNDIDLEGHEWEPIGNSNVVFNGHFDGNGHVIKNFHIINYNGDYSYQEVYKTSGATTLTRLYTDKMHQYNGFFGKTGENSVVKNLGIENARIHFWNHDYYYNIETDSNNVLISSGHHRAKYNGTMVGYAGGEFINCYVKNSEIKNMKRDINDWGIGAFAGYADANASFRGCYIRDTKIAGSYYSLLAGFVSKAEKKTQFTDCYSSGVAINYDFASHTTKYSSVYGFGCVAGGTPTVNCISDFADYSSITENASQYDASASIGTAEATKEEIIDTVASYENLAPDNFDGNVNDGYPICLWQMSSKAKQKYDIDSFEITDAITADLQLNIGKFGSLVAWTTTDSSIVDENGSVTFYPEDKTVTLTATTEDGYSKEFTVTVAGKVPFENYSFNVTKDGTNASGFVSGGTINKVSFYKNRAAEDCYMYTVLYDKTNKNRMIGCSIDFIDDSELTAKSEHIIDLSTPIIIPNKEAGSYVLKLIFVTGETTFKPVCDNFEYFE